MKKLIFALVFFLMAARPALADSHMKFQADGKAVILNHTYYGPQISRFLGSSKSDLDETFSGTGTLRVSDIHKSFQPIALEIQNDQKIVVVGTADEYHGGNDSSHVMFAIRINSDGALDTSFGSGGLTTIKVGYSSKAVAAKIQRDGKIVIAGNTDFTRDRDWVDRAVVVQLDSHGILDKKFGKNGIIKFPLFKGEYFTASDMVTLDSGKIIVGGSGPLGEHVVMVSYNSDGSLNRAFGVNGISVVKPSKHTMDGVLLKVLKDQKILLTGVATSRESTSLGSWRDFAAFRFNSHGSLDKSFGHKGFFIKDVGGPSGSVFASDDEIYVVEEQKDGKVLLAGYSSSNSVRHAEGIVRLNVDGSLDQTFANEGVYFKEAYLTYGIRSMSKNKNGDVEFCGEKCLRISDIE